MSSSKMNNDKRLLIGSTVGLLLGAGGLAAITLSQGGDRAVPTSSRLMLGQLGAGGQTSAPGAPGMPGVRPGAAAPAAKGAGTGGSKAPGNSFSDAPSSYPGGGGGGATAGGGGLTAGPPVGSGFPGAGGYGGGAPPFGGGVPTAGGVGGAAPNPSSANTKPAPVKNGVPATAARKDPFVSYRFFGPQKPPAYSLLAPLRLAKYPAPPRPPANPDPNIAFGPLPYVPRRVAGILYNGSVSAILETGNPGPGAQVDVVEPGSKVPSGVAGIPDLTVATITPTQITLRANDGRTVNVALSGVPAGLAGGLQQGQPGGGFPGGGFPGGGFPGGGGRGGFPGGGGPVGGGGKTDN